MYLIKSPSIVKRYYQKLIWDIPNEEKKIYLTFDDGPTPEVTEWVLILLEKYKIKATFFCLGCNIEKHPIIFNQIKQDGHTIGNHSYHHLNGWQADDEDYIRNIGKCNDLIQSKLFRPPYGRIKKSQAEILIKDYKVIMWDVLSGDFDPKTSPEKCYKNVVKHTKSGSVIVFHDSAKAFKNLQYTLPKAIDFLLKEGFVFDVVK